jgi:hypothetical protein
VVTHSFGALTQMVACSVCWGNAQEPVVHGTKLSIVFLLSLTYLLLGGGFGMVVMLRRRARSLNVTSEHPAESAAPSPASSRD